MDTKTPLWRRVWCVVIDHGHRSKFGSWPNCYLCGWVPKKGRDKSA